MSVLLAGYAPAISASASAVAAVPPACVNEAPTEGEAVAVAVACGRRVEVSSLRSEMTQVYAEPTGRTVLESAVVPQRARRADGTWAPINLHLGPGGDGLLRPGVSVADVRFSNGGNAPFVTLVRAGRTFTLSWPASLPQPVVSGDTATYRNVFTDVDLVVRATATGFTHVLVVKNKKAAANPAVRRIRIVPGGDASLKSTAGGALRAESGGQVLAMADPAVMWDSSMPSPPGGGMPPAGDDSSTGERSTPGGPGGAAREAKVDTELTTAGELLLTPDRGLLDGTSTYPVYIDPPWSTTRSRWAYATNNASNNTDYTNARVGRNPDSGVLFRSFFDFPLTAIKGKHIESAYVQMKLNHSWSCDNSWTHMYQSKGITATMRTSWTSTSFVKWLASAESHANEGDGCSDSPQPNQTVNFINSAVTTVIQQHAAVSAAQITIGFCACNSSGQYETSQDRWKRWLPGDAKLIVDYSSYPKQPTGLQVGGVTCPAGGLSIGTLSPTLSAILPDDDTTQTLSGQFEWLEIPASGVYDDTTPRKPAPSAVTATANGRSSQATISGLVAGKRYAVRVKATDPAPYSLVSPPSAWCEFWPDTSAAAPPVINPTTPIAGPGQPITFSLTTSRPEDADVVKFRYGWKDSPLLEVAATGTTTKTASVTVTAPRYGQNTFYAYGVDGTGNKGNDGSRSITVLRPAPAVAQWGLETYPGVSQTAALADRQSSLAGNTPLTPSGLTWPSDLRLVGGQVATFTGTAQAATTAPVIDSGGSFAVSAWVSLQNTTGFQTVVSKDGAAGQWSPFRLQLRNDTGQPARWCLTISTSLSAGTGQSVCSTATVTANRWTHLAASYNDTEGLMRLWVDGAKTDLAFNAALNSTGPIVVGRASNAGAAAEPLRGSVADVQIFNRALVEQDLVGQPKSDPLSGGFDEPGILQPIEVGRWDMDGATPCYDTSIPDTCEAPDGAAWGRRLKLTQGIWADLGNRGQGLILDGTHFIEDPSDPFYGLATQEYGRSQRNAGGAVPPDWQDGAVLRTDQSFTVSAWARMDDLTGWRVIASQDSPGYSGFYLYFRETNGGEWVLKVGAGQTAGDTNATYAVAPAPEAHSWHHIVGVLDVGRKQIRLYVDGDPVRTTTLNAAWQPWQASGPFVVGRGKTPTSLNDWFVGAIDDVMVYQGALTDAKVAELFAQQSL